MSRFQVSEPLYVVTNDLRSLSEKISSTTLCLAADRVVPDSAVGAQECYDVWRIYVNSHDARDRLLLVGLPIGLHTVALHPKDPSVSMKKPTERVVIKDIPIPVSSESVLLHLQSLFPKLKISSSVQYAKDEQYSVELNRKVFSKYLTGDRFFYIETPVSAPLPKIIKFDGKKCRVWHFSQKFFCKRCDQLGHSAEETDVCEAYIHPPRLLSSGQDMTFFVICT